MLYEGTVDEALQIVKAVRDRYSRVRRSPWNKVECGDHYVRSMSSWSLLEAAVGYRYDAAKGLIGFAPRLSPDNFRAFFITAAGWGTFSQRRTGGREIDSLSLAYGELELRTLMFQRSDGRGTRLAA